MKKQQHSALRIKERTRVSRASQSQHNNTTQHNTKQRRRGCQTVTAAAGGVRGTVLLCGSRLSATVPPTHPRPPPGSSQGAACGGVASQGREREREGEGERNGDVFRHLRGPCVPPSAARDLVTSSEFHQSHVGKSDVTVPTKAVR
ncbi:hypothetical protein E2C01_071082 [Portunus trituberculatus]|uniref:Uncharacterized protein n=1 Tax=Portunus trituberculatus TaxID=210409 RepID=A0A5B7I719_PORTR|nr:hypothetical protein [Portunus trituberculatus]